LRFLPEETWPGIEKLSYLARQLGGDAETMASIITLQILLAFIAMPLIGFLLLL